MSDLTILLTLKGRPLFTLRFLWHANKVKLPFHVLVADGDVNHKIKGLLSSKKIFSNLNYEYHEYDDKTRIHYYKKLVDALGKVKTPYVKMADNDDFLFKTGLNKNIEFLEQNNDYVCAQGGIAGFELSSKFGWQENLQGRITNTEFRYSNNYRSRDLNHPDVVERVLDEARDYHSLYYGVYRTEVLKKIVNEILEMRISTSYIYERYWALRAVSLGKIRSDPTCLSYLRQKGTTLRDPSKDFVYDLMRQPFTDDIHKVIEILSENLSRKTGKEREEIQENLMESFASQWRDWIINRYGRYWLYRRIGGKQPWKKIYLKLNTAINSLSSSFFVPERIIFKGLKAKGSSKQNILQHKTEFIKIKETLKSDELKEFIEESAAELLVTEEIKSDK